MSYKKNWLLEDRVCFIEFSETVTLADVASISQSHEEWLVQTTSSANVHYLMNMTQISCYPKNIFAINNALKGQLMQTGWLIVITQDYLVNYIADIFGKKLSVNVKRTQTVLEGYRFLQEVDEVPVPQNWLTDSDETMPVRAVF